MNKKVIHTVFENVVTFHGTNTAIETDDARISYKHFNEEANKIAHVLHQKGLQNECKIAVFCENALAQLIALMGVFKSGNVYVPLSAKYKQNHWDVLFNKVQPKTLIITEENIEIFEKFSALFDYKIPELIVVNTNAEHNIVYSFKQYKTGVYTEVPTNILTSTENLNLTIDENGANYIFFTSGSTGKPKAVLGKHKSLSHFIHWEAKELALDSNARIGQLTSFSFDASLRDIFLPLLKGGCICLPSKETLENTTQFCDWLIEKRITVLHTVPTMMRSILKVNDKKVATTNYFKDLQFLLLAGEKLYGKDILSWREKFGNNTTIINLYGATESTLVKTFFRLESHMQVTSADVLSVGKPISNTNILILNAENNICEIGEIGDIYIQTPFLTHGYYKDVALTAEKFVQNPLSTSHDIIYKTGDYGKYDIERNTIVLGRKDGILKINGVRCDINSIEKNVLAFPGVKEVKCIPHLEKGANQMIMCFYTASEEIIEELRNYCLKTLSEYEFFALHFLRLDKFPINANGKTDTTVLGEKVLEYFQQHKEIVAPENEIEEKLVAIWKELLGINTISTLDNIFSLGANSIHLIQVAGKIHADLGIELSILDLFNTPIIKDQAEKIQSSQKTNYNEIPNVAQAESYTASSSQFRLWILSQYEESSLAYHMPDYLEIETAFNITLFKKAIFAVIERHEILRTVFTNIQGEFRQVVKESNELNFTIDYKDFRRTNNTEQAVASYIETDSYVQFDFENGPLIRMALLHTGEDNYVFYYNMHHVISDGWSKNILARDVMAYYKAFVTNTACELPELSIQYKDYASWQQAQLSSNAFQKHKEFWLEQLAGTLPVFDLPSTKIRPKVYNYSGKRLVTYLSPETTQTLKQYCTEKQGTLFVGLLAIWKILLRKYSGQEDIIMGSPVSGRDHLDLQDQIGFYVNTLALRNTVDTTQNFDAFFEGIKQRTLQSFEHQMYPFDKLVEHLSISRDMSRNPVFDIFLTLQNTGEVNENLNISPDLYNTIEDAGGELAKFDVSIHFKEVGKGLYFQITYNTEVYEETMIRQLMNHYKALTANLLATPTTTIDDVKFITRAEEQKQLIDFNTTKYEYPTQTVCNLFTEHVATNANQFAVTDKNKAYTYKTLDEKSNQVANYILQNYTATEKSPVAVLMDRSVDLIVVLLGILKSGRSYIPLDPMFPEERLEYIVKHSEVAIIFGEEAYSDLVGNPENYVSLTDVFSETQKTTAVDYSEFQGDAYIIYTSGSTGNPKGVQIGHQSLVNFLISIQKNQGVDSTDTLFSVTTQSFDISILEFFVPLISGGTVYITSKESLTDPFAILEEIKTVSPTIIQATPSFYQMLFNAGWQGDATIKILCGGDLLNKSLAEKMLANSKEVWNMYGPTETTIWSSTKRILEPKDASNIGKPIHNTQLYILDKAKNILPEGVAGEIYISGDGLAKGYVKDQLQTDQKFTAHPFIAGEKIYNTGDLGKWNSEGEIEFLGRNDFQVKIRGHRIELGEIEYCLAANEALKQVVVIASKGNAGQSELVAYFVAETKIKTSELRNYVGAHLPGYMIPSHFIQLDKIPLTPNKKVDRKALPSIETLGVKTEITYVAPKTPAEIILTTICSEVLGVKQIGLKDNFYHLGGDSIKLIHLISVLRGQNYTLKPKHAVTALDMKDLATRIEDASNVADQEEFAQEPHRYTNVTDHEIVDLSGNQQHMFKLNTTIGVNDFMIHNFNEKTFENSFRTFLNHFPSLCVHLVKNNGKTQQQRVSASAVKIDFSYSDEDQNSTAVEAAMDAFFVKPFNLYEEALIRVFAVKSTNTTKTRIAIGIHHGLTDFYSNMMLRDSLIQYFDEGAIAETHTSNFEFIKAQQKHLTSKAGKSQRKFWVKHHKNIAKKKQLETNIQYISDFTLQKIVITGQDLEFLRGLSYNMKVPINGLLQVLHGYIIKMVYGKQRNIQGILVNGRDQKIKNVNIATVVGVLNNTLPLQIAKIPNSIFKLNYFKEVYADYIEARMQQQIPFETVKNDVMKATGVDIEASLGGVFDYQKRENEYLENGQHTIKTIADTRTKQEGIYIKCFEYDNALEINLSCPSKIYKAASKETISLEQILNTYLHRITGKQKMNTY